ncbi:MAG: hypothetical protein ACK4Q5_13280 [Saprospiraceae bacterium]
MKNFFEFLGFLTTALLVGAAFFLYLGHAKNLPDRSRAAAAAFVTDDGIEYDDAPAERPKAKPEKRKQLPDFERIAAYPAGEIPARPEPRKKPSERPATPAATPKTAPKNAPPQSLAEKPKTALAYVVPESREAAKTARPAAAKPREKTARTATEPTFVSAKATPAELNFREMVAREQGFRSWSKLQSKASRAQKSQADRRVKMLLASSRIR